MIRYVRYAECVVQHPMQYFALAVVLDWSCLLYTSIMFWVFLTGNIYVVTIVNNLIYILLIALLYNVSKRSAIFWAVIYNCLLYTSQELVQVLQEI